MVEMGRYMRRRELQVAVPAEGKAEPVAAMATVSARVMTSGSSMPGVRMPGPGEMEARW